MVDDQLRDPAAVYALLLKACRALDESGDHAVAAIISHGMAMMQAKYGVGDDDPEPSDDD